MAPAAVPASTCRARDRSRMLTRRCAIAFKRRQPGDVIVSNSDWHEAQLKEQRLPLRDDLDRIAPHNPVVLVRGGHEYILNSAALTRWEHHRQDAANPRAAASRRYADGRAERRARGHRQVAGAAAALPAAHAATTTRGSHRRLQEAERSRPDGRSAIPASRSPNIECCRRCRSAGS